jgi:hypothetical protein
MKLEISKDWCIAAAKREGDSEVGAGALAMDPIPPWLNGEPYYCKLCGAGGGERMACEWPTCELEDRATAQARALSSDNGTKP